jgi:hypothetical protein
MKEFFWAIDTFLRTELLNWAMDHIPFILFGVLFCGFGLLFTIFGLFYMGRKLNKIASHQLMVGAELEKLLEMQVALLKSLLKKAEEDQNQK